MSYNRKRPRWVMPAVVLAALACCCCRRAPSGGAADIVAADLAVELGAGWYELETYEGQRFRWVNNDAEIILTRGRRTPPVLAVELEPGPGVNPDPLVLSLRDEAGRRLQVREVRGRETVELRLPADAKPGGVYKLHAEGGGKVVPSDPRVLNFRVFRVSAAPSSARPDIVDSREELLLGEGWYDLETWRGETFRWAGKEALIRARVSKPGDYKLAMELEPGPGVGARRFLLKVLDSAGRQVDAVEVPWRARIELYLPFADTELHTFRLHAPGGGMKTGADPRILNFRVFRIGLQE